MAKKKGIQIILAPGVSVGRYKFFNFLAVAHRSFRERRVRMGDDGPWRRSVTITSATLGAFGFSGAIWLDDLFGFNDHLRSFSFLPVKAVLEVRDLAGKLIQRNWYCCTKCWRNSGTGDTLSKDYRCAKCGQVWYRDGHSRKPAAFIL
ncbi:MAG: hypothetical protein AAB561_00440 [Patescibacteria group bacterium]